MANQAQPPRRSMPTWFDWLESNFPFKSPFAADEHAIRIEEYQDGDVYTVRAEIPGVDPDRDIEIGVERGNLTLAAERAEQFVEGKRSEFHYGYLTRTIPLPEGVDEDDITADYVDGVLTVSAPVRGTTAARRRVTIGREPRTTRTTPPPEPVEGLNVSTPEPTVGMHGVSDRQEQRPENDVMRTDDPPESGF
jgi:HSP20 family protein